MTEVGFLVFRGVIGLAIIAITVAICVSDARERRIPNKLVLAGLALALVFHAFAPLGYGLFDQYAPGGVGLSESAAGAGAVFAFFFVLYLLRVMGAGDVKLVAFYGALFGGSAVIDFTITVFLCGGVLALSRMFDANRRHQVLMNLKLILMDRIVSPAGSDKSATFNPERDTADRLPFALAICAAATLVAFSQMSGHALPWSLTV